MKNRIRETRGERGLSQQRLAELSGLTIRTIADIESAKSEPRIGTAQAIARALGVPLSDLFADDAA